MKKISLSLFAKKSHVNDEGIDGYDWDESQPKWPLSRIVSTSFGVISVIVWILILFRIFATSGTSFEERILLNDQAAAFYPSETRQVLRIHSDTGEDAENGVVVSFSTYLEKADNFQLTARVNRRVFAPGKGEMGYTFVLRESGEDGTRFIPLSYSDSLKKFNYTFFRLCFEGVDFHKDSSYTLLMYRGEYLPENGEYTPSKADFRFPVYTPETYTKNIICKKDVFVKQ